MLCAILLFIFGANTQGTHGQGATRTYTSWSPDNRYIAAAQGDSVQVVDVMTLQMVWQQNGMWEQAAPPQWSPDGTKLAVGNGSVLEIWSGVRNGEQPSRELTIQANSYIHSIAWNPQGDRVAIAHHALEVWELPSVTLLYRVYAHGNYITEVSWRADGTQIATASADRTLKIWDAGTGVVTQTMTVLRRDMNLPVSEIFVVPTSVRWQSDESLLIFGVADGTVRLWDTEELNAAEVRTTALDPRVMSTGSTGDVRIESVDVNDFDGEIVSGAGDGTLTVWDIDTSEVLRSFQTNLSLDSVSYSQFGGRLLISGGQASDNGIERHVILNESLLNGGVQIVVPDPSLERLQSIAELCNAPLTVADAIPDATQTDQLADFITQVESLPADSIPPACAADLIAVAEAIQAGQ